MLNIDNELFENLDAKNILPINNDSFEVSNLIKDYDLESENKILNTIDSQYETVTEFIVGLYLEKQDLPADLKEFVRKSHNYRIFLLENIKKRMKEIINESSVHLFKEIYIILNLLSNGNRYELLDSQNLFSIRDLQILLNDYEDNVCEQFIKNDKQNFNLWFKYYLALLEVLNEICVINSLDIQRRKNINGILELITNTITNLKSKIQLEENEILALNAILGKLLLYFTNMSYISIDINNKDMVIQKYAFMLGKIKDGYELLNQNDKYYLSFIDKLTTLILTLIYKLKSKLHIHNVKFEESKDLLEIYNLYNLNVKDEQKIEASDLNSFRDKLLENYKYLYKNSSNTNYNEQLDLIDYFISLNEISNVDMIIIHNIVLYSDEIPKNKLDLLVKSLLEKNKFDNDYYEFYKLRILDRALQKYISLRVDTMSNAYIDDIIKYIEKNNIVSHLMSMYAKIYLSLSLYFSYEKTPASQEKSKNFYFIYQRLDNYDFLEKEFNNISKQILLNYALNYFKSFNFRTKNSFSNIELVEIGKDLVSKYIKNTETELLNSSLLYNEKLIKEILEINEPNDIWLNERLETLIGNKIFFGLVKVGIEYSNDSLNILEVGYDNYKIEIAEDFILNLYYSSYYKTTFERLIDQNRDFIELLARNLFKSYHNSIPSYTDVITKLPNINKLRNELNRLDNKQITFFEVYLNSIVNFSESYNVKTSNEFFREVVQKINEETDCYRLFGPKIGVILDEEKEYKEIVSFLQELKVTYENEEYDLNPIIAISIGEARKILDKSFYSLSSAKISNDKLYIFE